MPRYIRDQWEESQHLPIKKGDYVVATKYRDGDPGDQFCVGFYDRSFHLGDHLTRHRVTDSNGNQFRWGGFRRVARVGTKRGTWIVQHLTHIEQMKDRFSVWHWYRAPWRELNTVDQ